MYIYDCTTSYVISMLYCVINLSYDWFFSILPLRFYENINKLI